ncbi:hypothetical protein HPB50_008971 [Hyalomma asiaticum]|uniref:Uncharacterized protein n=1 Tax=Hyalomma asiaticum TaxID=266040 RepID=A0ACB7S1N7_HYAAI|nr:hypothetical protein HPB50_008971 [Hyalomma asiaticum]
MQTRLLKHPNPSLDDAVKAGEAVEAAAKDAATFTRHAWRPAQAWQATLPPRESPRVLYADASLQKHSDHAAVVVTSKDRLIVSASLKTSDPPIAEEMAVALALAQPSVDTVVNDSRTAYGSFHGEGVISSTARAILSMYKPSEKSHRARAAGNTIADYHAQEMSIRAEHELEELPHPVTSFQDITQMYREERHRLPEPHPKLTRPQQMMLRRV